MVLKPFVFSGNRPLVDGRPNPVHQAMNFLFDVIVRSMPFLSDWKCAAPPGLSLLHACYPRLAPRATLWSRLRRWAVSKASDSQLLNGAFCRFVRTERIGAQSVTGVGEGAGS
jgi:hypothetical protein